MKNVRRKLLSQNFFHDRRLVAKLVDCSSIDRDDLVLEIGPGNGIITRELLNKAKLVIAVELDPYWHHRLQTKFTDNQNLILYKNDFLTHPLPKLTYKVFANIPFAIEGKVIRKLIEADNPPQDCYLVVMSNLAKRLVAENTNNMFSIMHKPWFEFSIVHQFVPTDFSPTPNVSAVLFRFVRKKKEMLSIFNRKKYQSFIKLGYGHGQAISANLKKRFPRVVVDNALQSCSISKKTKPSHLNVSQWISLYHQLNCSGLGFIY